MHTHRVIVARMLLSNSECSLTLMIIIHLQVQRKFLCLAITNEIFFNDNSIKLLRINIHNSYSLCITSTIMTIVFSYI